MGPLPMSVDAGIALPGSFHAGHRRVQQVDRRRSLHWDGIRGHGRAVAKMRTPRFVIESGNVNPDAACAARSSGTYRAAR